MEWVDPHWKEFIEQHIDEIEDNNWVRVYHDARYVNPAYIGQLTDIFYEVGLDPLKHLTYVPKNYMKNSRNIEHVVIPEGILSIEEHAFEDSSLKSVTISESVERICAYAFQSCTNLTTVTIKGTKTVADATAWVFDYNVKFVCNKDNEQIKAIAYTFDYPIQLV